ncbi:IS30 family transposase [Sulfitobacter pseudonitzschiae]|uniref:IS30 family transposase n=2 Tax=Pseudosulfitobacter pseudonitzschiae TaxID=1402135 RepID=A0A9Q2NP80_9RHOB|nr:IS30 family transposase [Pseudosulfitobacter pseudonitzschiae]MBM2294305.1 IS30 family transposase [Pseudosulfitobacter pseudonitzschiae]MBM2299230.1 IS30 family transposase [Pseudosulfitobacter pseudonitzschiae]MBM2304138.1 IS30 family transposase [Pseudosulfitobacter pseudonitzschiae]MBM2313918.1 IS30 family transposase [Pseudosulfitobacter pseudonitzschiae]MBM2318832.1 IS30 family transposase [Pseudosulfitobacter pseudonitzschiae]
MGTHYCHLKLDERRKLAKWLEAKMPISEIADRLGRDPSTIYRDIKRNRYTDDELPELNGYHALVAQDKYEQRRAIHRKMIIHPDLKAAIEDRLKAGWSPEQIAGRLRIEPCPPYRICHETIYQYVYSESGQSQELGRYLPERQRKRKPRYARKARDRVFPLEISIHNRPDEINNRSQFGNWEGDLMIFERAQGNANVATLIERKTRYTLLLRNNDRKSRPLMNKLINEMSPLPADARRSITFDRGFEFTSWRELHKGMGTKSWFCDPQAPWQKGSVENMNKRIRRYLPRDTALLALPSRYMKSICDRLNETPRKCLGYRTPAEAFRDELMKLERG